jgi:hypothetical protein
MVEGVDAQGDVPTVEPAVESEPGQSAPRGPDVAVIVAGGLLAATFVLWWRDGWTLWVPIILLGGLISVRLVRPLLWAVIPRLQRDLWRDRVDQAAAIGLLGGLALYLLSQVTGAAVLLAAGVGIAVSTGAVVWRHWRRRRRHRDPHRRNRR